MDSPKRQAPATGTTFKMYWSQHAATACGMSPCSKHKRCACWHKRCACWQAQLARPSKSGGPVEPLSHWIRPMPPCYRCGLRRAAGHSPCLHPCANKDKPCSLLLCISRAFSH